MTSNPRLEGECLHHYQQFLYHEHLSKQIDVILFQFEKLIRSYVLFNLFFLIIGVFEIALLIGCFSLLVKSSILGFGLGFLFLTTFSYFLLRIYLQAKKEEQFFEFRDQFLTQTKKLLHYEEKVPEHHLALAAACCRLADRLEGREYKVMQLPRFFKRFQGLVERFCLRCFWGDFHRLKELLLNASVEEHIKLVTCEPTNLEFHAALANAYVTLSGLYADSTKGEGEEEREGPKEKNASLFADKFRFAAKRAIEEFKIMNDYAPNDPWVHAQLAYSYHDLKMPNEEIKEYEILLSFHPKDKDILFKLGRLYFEQGYNAKGLRIYDLLKQMHYKKAEQLLNYYGTYLCY